MDIIFVQGLPYSTLEVQIVRAYSTVVTLGQFSAIIVSGGSFLGTSKTAFLASAFFVKMNVTKITRLTLDTDTHLGRVSIS